MIASQDNPVEWAGRKFGDLSPDEQRRAMREAASAMQDELRANADGLAKALSAAPDRKWRMTRLKAGDWLLPSNDRSTVFRISTYEDGESYGLEGVKDRTYWGVWHWPKPLKQLAASDPWGYDPFDDWDAWVQIGHSCATRQEAIDAALRWEVGR